MLDLIDEYSYKLLKKVIIDIYTKQIVIHHLSTFRHYLPLQKYISIKIKFPLPSQVWLKLIHFLK